MVENSGKKRPPRPGDRPQKPGRLPKAPMGNDKQHGIGEKTMVGSVSKPDAHVPQPEPQPVEDADAIIKVLSRGTVSNYRLKESKISTLVGSHRESCDIVLNDPAIARQQLAIIRYEDCYILADCGVNDLTSFDGVVSRQIICPTGSTCVINMNMSTLIFDSAANLPPNRKKARKRFHLDPLPNEPATPAARFIIRSGERSFQSDSEPILIGSHSGCQATARGEGVAPFHALVHWSPVGVCVTRLGKHDVLVNTAPIEKTVILSPGDLIRIGPAEFGFEIEGDIRGRCDGFFGGYKLDFNYLRFTAMPHSVCGSFMLPGIGGAVMVGRSSRADITLDDGAVSREHLQIIPNGKSCQVIDNYSANCTFVNNEKITKARLRSGDLLEVGRSVFVLHYD